MKIRNIEDAAQSRTKVVDFSTIMKKKERHVQQMKKLQDVRAMARKMGIDTRNRTLTELIREIQKAEGNEDCFLSGQVVECGQTNCLWREDCEPAPS